MAVRLAERPFGLQKLRVDHALDDDLGIRRHFEIVGDAAHGLHGFAQ